MLSLQTNFLPQYCERIAQAGEPLNVLSALILCIAGFVGLRRWRLSGAGDAMPAILAVLVVVVGLSSCYSHLSNSPLGLLAEEVSGQVFILAMFAFILHRMLKVTWLGTALNVVAFVLTTLFVRNLVPETTLGGGGKLIVPLLALYLLGMALIIEARLGMHRDTDLRGAAATRSDAVHFPQLRAGYALIQAGILLAVGLVIRSFDLTVCAQVVHGTHWIWHIVLAGVTYLLLESCVRFARPQVFSTVQAGQG